jgi:hypothetical protein
VPPPSARGYAQAVSQASTGKGDTEMKWLLLLIPAAVVAVVVAIGRRKVMGGFDFEQMIQKMPEGAPPRWAYDNVTAVRKNTERIIELLEAEK